MEIPYAVGGSVASSAHGMPRTTMDGDVVVDVKPEQIAELVESLQPEFYADAEMMRDAFRLGRACTVIHYSSAFKFDLFPVARDEYSRVAFARRMDGTVHSLGHPVECSSATPEDMILSKLDWFRRGGETSKQPWTDLRGIVEVSGPKLDLAYLRRWAAHLRVGDLLDRLLAE
jgi:hypothetical protein